MPTTIGRNRRQYVINVRTQYTECHRYDPTSGSMVVVPCDEAWALLASDRRARLIENDGRVSYIIRLGRKFYELRKPNR